MSASPEQPSEAPVPALELRNVTKSFPGVTALDRVSFDVLPGEVHALLGENGAGKSTLIKIVSGVYRPDEGELLVSGEPVALANPGEAQTRGIATIYQEFSLYPELTVAENIFAGHMPKTLFGLALDWRRATKNARTVLESLDAADLDVNARVGTLSVGNRQRVEIAKALSRQARILILDEPTAVLTQHDTERLFGIIAKLRTQKVAIIYISHRLEEIFRLADRVTVLRDGKLVGIKQARETDEGELIRMMVGRALAQEPSPHLDAEPVTTAPFLVARNLSRRPLLKHASLELRPGEIVGLAGLIGSGRSELAQAIFGIAPPETGVIEIEGRPVRVDSPEQGIAFGIAYVPEDRQRQGLLTAMTVSQNIGLTQVWKLVKGPFLDNAAEEKLADEYIASLRIKTPSRQQLTRNLSGGNQQKIVVAKWLATQPKLLIVDEPTRGIDVGARAEIHRLLDSLAHEHKMAILVISSDLPEILRLSDRIGVMREGVLVAEFRRKDATEETIAAAALGQTGAATNGRNGSPISGAKSELPTSTSSNS
ncbi:MAG: sugar ABC transporter ATP-binding protein [Verrucomicrobia bacterium]|nr:sugar ABC transporter ATP-binding protein [Verrucomicrobiota bacterium]